MTLDQKTRNLRTGLVTYICIVGNTNLNNTTYYDILNTLCLGSRILKCNK